MFRLTICIFTVIIPTSVFSQSIPDVPFDLEFANVTVHLTQLNRLRVKQEIQQFYIHRATIDYIVNTTRQLAPHLNPLLEEFNLPNDFIYAAIPSFDGDTLGFWGLAQSQGRRLKLRMDGRVDERFHFLSSTTAVLSDIDYWQKSQDNYAAALLCYLNEGSQLVPDRINSSYLLPNAKSGVLFWKILARKLIVEHEYSINNEPSIYSLYNYQNGAGKTFQDIADRLYIPIDRIEFFNRWLKAKQIPIDKNYSILIQLKNEEFPQIQPSAEPEKSVKKEPKFDLGFPVLVKLPERNNGIWGSILSYLINGLKGIQAQACDNIITLAYYGDISIKAFLKYNDLTNSESIHPGDIYYLEPKMKRGKIPFHIVQKDQTLRAISAIYGLRLKSLEKFNHVSTIQRLQTGRVLWLQRKRSNSQSFEYLQQPSKKPDKSEIELPLVTAKAMEPTVRTPETTMDNSKMSTKNVADTIYDKSRLEAIINEELAESNRRADRYYTNSKLVKTHKVRVKETYYSIARLYSITVQQLYAWNKRSDWDVLKIGDELVVRPMSSTSNELSTEHLKSGMGKAIPVSGTDTIKQISFYTVQPKQTLYQISLINKVTVSELMRWNNLVSYTIKVGQKLTIRK